MLFRQKEELQKAKQPIWKTGGPIKDGYSTGPGERTLHLFKPGIKTLLNANTNLTTITYKANKIVLRLDGEAFFDLSELSPKKQIKIQSSFLNIESTGGCMFKISAHRVESGEEIDVLKGIVKAKKNYSSDADTAIQLLGRGQMLMLNRDIDLIETETFDPIDLSNWYLGNLYFSNLNMNNLAQKLENWYGVTIDIDIPPKKKEKYSGNFPNLKLQEILGQFFPDYVHKFDYTTNTVKLIKINKR